MAEFDVEYTICIIQRDAFSFAAKSHRQENGNPRLWIDTSGGEVVWRLTNLDQGVPEIISGSPQADRIDFYFRRGALQEVLPDFPQVKESPMASLKLKPTDASGTERVEGKRVRIVQPVCRFYPLSSVRLIVNKQPAFEALATDAYLHLDFETGPARIYGREIFEVHFGVEAAYDIQKLETTDPTQAVFEMSQELYATILDELHWVLR